MLRRNLGYFRVIKKIWPVVIITISQRVSVPEYSISLGSLIVECKLNFIEIDSDALRRERLTDIVIITTAKSQL